MFPTDVCLGDCLKFTKMDPEEPSGQSEKEANGSRTSEKRPSEETDPGEVPVKKKKTEVRYEEGSCWSVWDLVWVRRRQVMELLDKTNKTTVEVEAAVTEAVTNPASWSPQVGGSDSYIDSAINTPWTRDQKDVQGSL